MYIKMNEELGQISALKRKFRSARINRYYARKLGWGKHYRQIALKLGFTGHIPGFKAFTLAVSRWQKQQGLRGDGIIGPNSWAHLRRGLRPANSKPPLKRVPSTGFTPTPVESPGGGRVKDKSPPIKADLVSLKGYRGKPIRLHRHAAMAWAQLLQAALSDGIGGPLLHIISGFRDPKHQQKLWKRAIKKYGSPQQAPKWVAPPGRSAHQSGRAIDLYLGGKIGSRYVTGLRKKPAYQWLVNNAERFGFYPYQREPWHWEYNPPV